ncbi:MAG: hypothetical protein K9L59_19580, partial [Desulfobacterales bacterium]|nr:hypothetical protein [Desulfobacterales bacterium]
FRHSRAGGNPVFSNTYKVQIKRDEGFGDFLRFHQGSGFKVPGSRFKYQMSDVGCPMSALTVCCLFVFLTSACPA